ncbi:efflux RND transporter periplasmic adaptor subunit [Cyclobacterium amurskyense]|jgi:HlyD family secretion protein|uniref:Macrolide-specific efflux protein MacA n=1 Tax=Cyclobacterium amurskyense TaxID=320787 RepID=A0A0H4PHR4_9BACT|nr:efflux RND transporter periplasmic adaptor subunit [Cyclobacterium amurskyense]AKP54056.1 Macrolide-specific efflux protein MacA [Cyclobacterium amurskyense]|tara:strand:- start:22123 stop:23433 length:1311 start_codon:yes stop_codon:yes gene_type:complete
MAKKKSNKLIYILLGIVAVLVIVMVVGKQAGWIGGEKPLEVQIGKVSKKDIVEKVSASGVVQPETEVKMSPDVAGEIIELNVNEGDSVKVGDLLVKIRPDNFISALDRAQANLNQQMANLAQSRASLKRAEAQYNRSKLNYDRNLSLYNDKVISDADFEQIKADFLTAENDLEASKQSVIASEFIVKSAKASVDEAGENLRLTNVYSPTDGIVSNLLVEKGERVVGTAQMAGTEMLRIADLSKMEVRVNVNENDIVRISMNDTTLIEVDSYSSTGKKFTGVVTAIANSANEKVSTDAVTEFEVRIRIINESYKDLVSNENPFPFRPGMTASVEIITDKKVGVLAIPLAAVTVRTGQEIESGEGEGNMKELVFLKNDNKAKIQEVKTGISDFENIEILEGLEEGQEVIVGPYFVVSTQLENDKEVTVSVPEGADSKK